MFKCQNCNAIFEEPKKGQEERGERFGEKCYEEMFYCPECGIADIEEGEICRDCGVFGDYPDIQSGFCRNCVEKAYTSQIGLECLEEKDLLKDFSKYILSGCHFQSDFWELKAAIQGEKKDLIIYDVQKALKDFLFEEWHDIAEIL